MKGFTRLKKNYEFELDKKNKHRAVNPFTNKDLQAGR